MSYHVQQCSIDSEARFGDQVEPEAVDAPFSLWVTCLRAMSRGPLVGVHSGVRDGTKAGSLGQDATQEVQRER